MIYVLAGYRRLFLWGVLFKWCCLSYVGYLNAGGIVPVSDNRLEHEKVYFLSTQNTKIALPPCLASLTRSVHASTNNENTLKVNLSQSLVEKLVTLLGYVYSIATQETVAAQIAAAYKQITFEDILQVTPYVYQLQYPEIITRYYEPIFVQKFLDAAVLERCAADKKYTCQLIEPLSEEYFYPVLDKILAQRGYLLWGALHIYAALDINKCKKKEWRIGLTKYCTLTSKIEREVAKKRAQGAQLKVLCSRLIQERLLLLVTSDGQRLWCELYDIKKRVLLAQMSAADVSSHESRYLLDLSPDMLKIKFITINPDFDKVCILLGQDGATRIKAVVQTFDISCAARLLPTHELLYLLICEHAKIQSTTIDQAYITYFLNDPHSFMHEAIARYKHGGYLDAIKRCSIS